jgi:hypothetical protein
VSVQQLSVLSLNVHVFNVKTGFAFIIVSLRLFPSKLITAFARVYPFCVVVSSKIQRHFSLSRTFCVQCERMCSSTKRFAFQSHCNLYTDPERVRGSTPSAFTHVDKFVIAYLFVLHNKKDLFSKTQKKMCVIHSIIKIKHQKQ